MKTPQELLQQALEAGECLLPDAPPGGRSAHPTVFVHGLLGWGAQDALYRAVPYWGLAAGDVLGYLNRCGYDCRAASVGIISSAWDRACELYAALTGGRADYGIAHAQHFGHARFGTAYPAPLVPGWGADRPIDLVGHSFGGATARLLMQLLAHGCPEEVQAAEAAGETPSPLFTGGRIGWVHALVAIAAPHDGSTFPDVQPDAANALSTLFLGAARALNARIDTLPDAWYFSIPCCRTLPRLLTHDQKPDTAMTPLLWPFSTAMGRALGAVPSDWLPNDGLVNTVSARCPGGAPHTDFAPGQTPQRGVWQVLPVEDLDHLAAIGGVMNTGVVRTRMFYRRVMALLDAAAAAGANS